MKTIDRLLMRATGPGVFLSVAFITKKREGTYEVMCSLWDGVPNSARGRDEWRIKGEYGSLEEAEAAVEAIQKKYPGKEAPVIIFDRLGKEATEPNGTS